MVDGGVRGNRGKFVIKGIRNRRRKYGWKGGGGHGKRRSRKKGNYGGGGIVVGRGKREKDLRTDKGGWWENSCVGGSVEEERNWD